MSPYVKKIRWHGFFLLWEEMFFRSRSFPDSFPDSFPVLSLLYNTKIEPINTKQNMISSISFGSVDKIYFSIIGKILFRDGILLRKIISVTNNVINRSEYINWIIFVLFFGTIIMQ